MGGLEVDSVNYRVLGSWKDAGRGAEGTRHHCRPHLDVVRELRQVLDDLPVLCWLHLQELLNDDH